MSGETKPPRVVVDIPSWNTGIYPRLATIIGQSRDGRCWRVVCDGLRKPYTFWKGYCSPLPDPPAEARQ